MSNEDVLRAVLASWSQGHRSRGSRDARALRRRLRVGADRDPHDDGPGRGRAAHARDGGAWASAAIEVDYRNVVAAGDVVCTERVDHILGPDGARTGSFPVVGVTEFRDGKISSWREYFDSANLAQLA